MKQKTWEAWFIVSVVLFFAFFFVGTIPGSVDTFPNFLYGFIPAVINLAACLLYSTKDSEL